jgi:NhaC family Na+:H+ antiporter
MNIKISRLEASLVIIVSLILTIGCIAFSLPLYQGFLGGIIFTAVILIKNGYSIKNILKLIVEVLKEAKMLYVVILLIGAITSVWLASGVVPAMMYYGFTYMRGMNFLLAAFIIISLISVFMGTAVGTISTIGIALLGIGKGFGIPSGILVGVIVSGAFIADKISPISGLLNLTLTTVNKSYKEVLKRMLPTLLPVVFITGAIYYIIGLDYTQTDMQQILSYQNAIAGGFNLSPVLLLLPVAVFVIALSGVKAIPTIAMGLLGGTAFAMFFQHIPILQVVKAIIWGYKGTTLSRELNEILFSGGVISMIEVLCVVMGAVALIGLFEKSGVISPLIEKFILGINTKSKLILRTGIISSLLTIITCDQTIGILLTGRVLQDKYQELKVDKAILARTISDTGTIIAPLMAWNINALIIKSVTAVSAQDYWVYGVLCYLFPVATVVVGVWGNNKIGLTRVSK